MKPEQHATLRRQAALRLFLALGAAMILTLIAGVWFYNVTIEKTIGLKKEGTSLHYLTRIRQLETSWEREAVLVKARIEFMRILEDEANRQMLLGSYFTAQSGNPIFSDIMITGRNGAVVFSHGPHSQFLPSSLEMKGYAGWYFDAPRRALYRVYRQPVWLGKSGMGWLLLFKPINNALLYANVFPDTDLFLVWQGVLAATSLGEGAQENVDAGHTGALLHAGIRYEQYTVQWERETGPELALVIRQRVERPITFNEVAAASLFLYFLLSVFLLLVLGRWLTRVTQRAAALNSATRLFAERREMVGDIEGHLEEADGGVGDELSKVALALGTLMDNVVKGDQARSRFDGELARQMNKLSQLNAELNEFTYVTSHDLQEPLRKLVIFSEWLERDLGGNLPERAAKDLQFISEAAARMRMLVEDLLALSRAGNREITPVRLNLDEMVDAALETLALRIAEKGAVVTRDPLPEVMGDATLLTQLYQNLISNAIKYNENSPCIHLDAQRDKDAWTLGVRDNGIGINPEYAEQIFLPFKRLHGRGQYEGTGIGLAICRKAVERHHGRIWVESGEGRGAWFRFSLPDQS
jgi:signal transduction histidine kinase